MKDGRKSRNWLPRGLEGEEEMELAEEEEERERGCLEEEVFSMGRMGLSGLDWRGVWVEAGADGAGEGEGWDVGRPGSTGAGGAAPLGQKGSLRDSRLSTNLLHI